MCVVVLVVEKSWLSHKGGLVYFQAGPKFRGASSGGDEARYVVWSRGVMRHSREPLVKSTTQ